MMLRVAGRRLLGAASGVGGGEAAPAAAAAGAVRRGYHERVVDHYNNPRNVGSFDKDDPDVGTGIVGAPACGDVMKLQIRVDEGSGRIVDARFKTFGCGSAIASSSVGGSGSVFPYGGRVGPLYPVFGRPRSPPRPRPAPETETATARVPLGRLLLVDREPTPPPQPPHADEDDLDTVPAEMYCPWSPGWLAAASPARCKKSGSTGSVLRWRPRLVGRSQSDGKEKFVFLSASASGSGRKGRSGGDGGGVAAALGGHAWSYYAKGGGVGHGGAPRRTYLPYKQDLVGLFANAAVFRRSYHPF